MSGRRVAKARKIGAIEAVDDDLRRRCSAMDFAGRLQCRGSRIERGVQRAGEQAKARLANRSDFASRIERGIGRLDGVARDTLRTVEDVDGASLDLGVRRNEKSA